MSIRKNCREELPRYRRNFSSRFYDLIRLKMNEKPSHNFDSGELSDKIGRMSSRFTTSHPWSPYCTLTPMGSWVSLAGTDWLAQANSLP